MRRYGAAAILALGAFLLPLASDRAQEPTKGDPAAVDQQVIKTTPTRVPSAGAVKFRKDLNLPFTSLSTLGARIDAARRAGDPVTLANAASELAVAEKVSGKATSLTSRQLIEEAAELARLRKQEPELQAVLEVSNKVNLAQEKVASLKKEIAYIQGLTLASRQALQKNEEPTSTPRKLIVNNYTNQYIDIQVNGYLQGQVLPGASQVFMLDQRWSPTILKGWGDSDEVTYGPVVIQGRFTSYTWNINGDSGIPDFSR